MRTSEKVVKRKLLQVFMIVLLFAVTGKTESNLGQKEHTGITLTKLEQKMQKKVSVNFNETSIDNVIKVLAEQANVDIIKSPEVTGLVTAKLTNVPLTEALDNILAAHGYGFITTKNMIRIAPAAELNEKLEKLVSRIYRITYADVDEVKIALKELLSPRGSLSSNPGTSNIIIIDSESKIKAVDAFIDEIDRITPQILVEVRIYDITTKDRLDLGIEWQTGRNSTFDTAGGITTTGPNPTDGSTNPFMTGMFGGATTNAETATGALRLGWLNDSIDIDMVLRAQQEKIQAKLLANPRVLVLDNKKALFKIISELPYQEISESSGGGSIGSTEFREVGVTLEVTPHVTRNEMIRLHLIPEFSVKAQDVLVGTGTSAENKFPVPVVDRRYADTTLLIRNGQTVVLGGLRKKEVTRQVNKVPLLGDIPLLGGLFRFEGEDTILSELVVFITPHIITNPALTETEKKQFEATQFEEPDPKFTKAEKGERKNQK